MATHDYIISNASGAAVRADLNNALAAIATNNSSSTAPTTTYAYQWWADTGSSPTVMKLRNAANSGWVTLFQLDGEWTVVPFENGTAAAPSIYFKDSGTDTGIYSPGADQVAITTGGTGRLFVTSSGSVGIGITSPSTLLHLASSSVDPTISLSRDPGSGNVNLIKSDFNDLTFTSFRHLLFTSGGTTERARIDSSGRLLVGTSTALTGTDTQYSRLVVTGNTSGASAGIMSISRPEAATSITTDEILGIISFADSGAGEYGRITCAADANAGTNDYPGRLVFSTTADGASSPTERMRIDNVGNLIINGSAATVNNSNSLVFLPGGFSVTNHINGTASGSYYAAFGYNGTTIGTITQNGTTAVAYNTSSDYRLKENVEPVTDGIARLQQLKPSRFNFIADPDKTVDGFLAHEVQAVVPEAIHGEKDAVDADGNPIYQGIDQSKLVPLLTAALQEAVAKIESLEARLTAAGL